MKDFNLQLFAATGPANGKAGNTRNILGDRVVVEMENVIAQLDPNAAPFTVMLMRMAKETVSNPKFEWMEDEFAPRWDAVNNAAGYNNAATAIVVDNAVYFTVRDLVQVPRTKEVMLVTAINLDTNTLTVRRGHGETAALAIVDNDPLQIIGNASPEGAKARPINQRVQVPQFNYTQIFRTTFGVTETLKSTKLYGGSELDYQRKKKGVEHKIDMERAFLFGERLEDLTNYDHPLRTTRGLMGWIKTNVKNMNAQQLTEKEFDNFAEMAFDKGSETKILLASKSLLSAISGWAKDKLQIEQGEKTYGLHIVKYITPHGTFKIVPHKLFTGAEYGKYGVAVDLKDIKMSTLKGRATKLKTNIQDNDEDKQKDEYITEAGLKVKLEQDHAIIKGWA